MHFLEDNRIELYDLGVDPFEQNNIAKENPELVAKMDKQLSGWKHDVGASKLKTKKGKNKDKGDND